MLDHETDKSTAKAALKDHLDTFKEISKVLGPLILMCGFWATLFWALRHQANPVAEAFLWGCLGLGSLIAAAIVGTFLYQVFQPYIALLKGPTKQKTAADQPNNPRCS